MVVNAVRPRLSFPSYPVAPTSLLTAHRRAGLGALAWSLIQGLYGLSYLLITITGTSSPAGFTVIGISPIPGNGFPPLGACPAPTMDGLAGTVSGSPFFQKLQWVERDIIPSPRYHRASTSRCTRRCPWHLQSDWLNQLLRCQTRLCRFG